MATKTLPDQATLLQLLRYDPETGALWWRERSVSMFADGVQSAEHNAAAWNEKLAEKRALTAPHGNGYFRGHILGQKCYAHRVIWKMMTGEDAFEIDHVDGDRGNNKFDNLRGVTRSQNRRNHQLSSINTSGVVGVSWDSTHLKWHAYIGARPRLHLGYFDRFDDAVAVRKSASAELEYHANHGRPAIVGREV